MKNKRIYRILLFYIIAIVISNLFRFDIFEWRDALEALPGTVSILSLVFLEGIGVLIGALIAIRLMRSEKGSTMSLFGTSKTKSLLLLILPIIILAALGINNSFGLEAHVYGLIAGAGTFVYCIFEEYGWRGYLQDELSELKPWKLYFIIGFLWYFWHLPFVSNPDIMDNLMFLGMLILGSWGIGQIAVRTKSVMACAAFHFVVNIFTVNQLIKNGFEGNSKWIAIGIILTLSVIIINTWPKTVGTLDDHIEPS